MTMGVAKFRLSLLHGYWANGKDFNGRPNVPAPSLAAGLLKTRFPLLTQLPDGPAGMLRPKRIFGQALLHDMHHFMHQRSHRLAPGLRLEPRHKGLCRRSGCIAARAGAGVIQEDYRAVEGVPERVRRPGGGANENERATIG
jgi:hypothetical protein